MDKAIARSIKIKTGVLKRSVKDFTYFREEAKQLEEKVDKLKADEVDEYDINKQTQVMQESLDLLPDCKNKIESALEDLKGLVEDYEDTEEYKESDEGQNANGIIAEASEFIETI
uniref:Tubulin-specific chaperone A n=1 Tax=Euplotes focardii TaxID=36767 RepID=A0A067YRT9_EUPFO|nr:beta-tubulin cofactor A [Euplotes focardii]|mmetsp:Transcript_31904/g.28260  ORF Transcript_31904/g.28260 Transcript_31904/m.28260 type:complete len:115 (-) Transcript_31904:53-397(-)